MPRPISRTLSAVLLVLFISLMIVASLATVASAAPARPVVLSDRHAQAIRAVEGRSAQLASEMPVVRRAGRLAAGMPPVAVRRTAGCDEEIARWYSAWVAYVVSDLFQPWNDLGALVRYLEATDALVTCLSPA
jgi:hypothetical protein